MFYVTKPNGSSPLTCLHGTMWSNLTLIKSYLTPTWRKPTTKEEEEGSAGGCCSFDVTTNAAAVSQIHTYDRKWLYACTHMSSCRNECRQWLDRGGICKLLSGLISLLRSQLNTLRWIIKAQGDLSCRVKLRTPCDHRVIMSCVSGSITCHAVVLHYTVAFHHCLRSSSSTGVNWIPAEEHRRQHGAENNLMFWPKVAYVSFAYSCNYRDIIDYINWSCKRSIYAHAFNGKQVLEKLTSFFFSPELVRNGK